MKFILILFTLALLSVNGFSQPSIYINDSNYLYLDTVTPSLLNNSVKVYNRGDEELIINSIGASCNCTNYSLESDTIAPNSYTMLNTQIDLTRSTGNRQYRIYLKSNDPEIEKFDLLIELFVYRDLEVFPKKLPVRFNLKKDDIVSYTFNVKNLSDKDMALAVPISSNIDLYEIVSFQPQDKQLEAGQSQEYRLEIQFKKEGMATPKIKIPTSSEFVPNIEFQLIAEVKK